MKIERIDSITPEFEEVVYRGFDNFAEQNNIELNFSSFVFALKDEQNKICGGLVGGTLYDGVHIKDLLVDESLRHRGYGFKLISEVEALFKGKEYTHITLSTYEFQAPKFYEKCGFELEFIRKNKKNPKLKKYYFIKRFEE